jgi:hypothetical protein
VTGKASTSKKIFLKHKGNNFKQAASRPGEQFQWILPILANYN